MTINIYRVGNRQWLTSTMNVYIFIYYMHVNTLTFVRVLEKGYHYYIFENPVKYGMFHEASQHLY